MRRTVLFCLAALLLAACGSESAPASNAQESSPASIASQPPAATTSAVAPTMENPLVADQALVRTLFYGLSQSSRDGLESHAEFMATHNHPAFAYGPDECLAALRASGFTDNYSADYVPDAANMATDEGWALGEGSGRYAGLVPDGRVYILPVDVSQAGDNVDDSYTTQLHAAVFDGSAYFFFGCDPD